MMALICTFENRKDFKKWISFKILELLVQEKIETVECIFTTGLLYIK
jgi:hypothetical protein